LTTHISQPALFFASAAQFTWTSTAFALSTDPTKGVPFNHSVMESVAGGLATVV